MSEHPLSGLHNFDSDERLGKDEWLHEEAVVKALLIAYRQDSGAKFDILKHSQERVGRKQLTLAGLREVTGISDRFLFESAVLPDIIKNCSLDKILRRFETRTITRRFCERYDERDPDLTGMPFALVVRCPYVPVGLVMHTSDTSVFRKGYRFLAKIEGLAITLETWEQFVKTELSGAGQ